MGSVSTPALAVAVADAGGVGSITALGMPVAFLEGLLADIAGRTTGAVAVNFLTEQLDRDALAVAASRARVLDFFWVAPSAELVEIGHAGGALVSWQVGSLDQAKAAVDAGADIIVAQGVEAGGHVSGHTPLLPLLSSVLDAVKRARARRRRRRRRANPRGSAGRRRRRRTNGYPVHRHDRVGRPRSV